MNETKSLSFKNDPVVRQLQKLGVTVTRVTYLAFAYPEGLPGPWTAEQEARLPAELQIRPTASAHIRAAEHVKL